MQYIKVRIERRDCDTNALIAMREITYDGPLGITGARMFCTLVADFVLGLRRITTHNRRQT